MTCPDDTKLAAFLDEELPEAIRRTIADHIDHCDTCQRRLDQLIPSSLTTSVDDISSGQTEFLEPGDRSAVAELIQRLQSPAQDDPGPSQLLVADFWTAIAPSNLPFTLDQYQLLELVGEGATGRLYRALDEQLNRFVAIKILKPELAAIQSARARFEREARACAALRHDHIVAVHRIESCAASGPPYLVMELVEGGSLQDRLESKSALPTRTLVEWIRQAALALQAAHEAGIVHRDIKPSNLLVDESTNRLRVADFGLARLTDAGESLTAEDAIAGTPAYMSPEQITQPKHVTGLSDVYSLGIVLYEALTGERPFRGIVRMVLNQVLHEEPVAPRRLNDRIPRDLETICLKAIAKESRARYATARAFADDLERWLDGRTVLARPVGALRKGWRWCRRNPRLAAAGAIVTVVLAAGAIDWGALRSTSIENRLRRQWTEDVARRDDIIATIANRVQTTERNWLLTLTALRSLISSAPSGIAGDTDTAPCHRQQYLELLSDELLNQAVATHASAVAARELGDLWSQLGDDARADQLLSIAASHAKQLLLEEPADQNIRLTLSGIQLRLARLKLTRPSLTVDDLEESEQLLKAAQESLSRRPVSSTQQAAVDQARILQLLGDLETRRENLELAAEHFTAAASRFAAIAEANGKASVLSEWSIVGLKLATALNRVDSQELNRVDSQDLYDACNLAFSLNEEAADGGDRSARARTAAALRELADCLTRKKRLAEALDVERKRCELLEQLAVETPSDVVRVRAAGTSWLRLATLHAQRQNWPESVHAAELAIGRLRSTLLLPTGNLADQLALAEAELLLVTAQVSDGSEVVDLSALRNIEQRLHLAKTSNSEPTPEEKSRASSLLQQCRELIDAATAQE